MSESKSDKLKIDWDTASKTKVNFRDGQAIDNFDQLWQETVIRYFEEEFETSLDGMKVYDMSLREVVKRTGHDYSDLIQAKRWASVMQFFLDQDDDIFTAVQKSFGYFGHFTLKDLLAENPDLLREVIERWEHGAQLEEVYPPGPLGA